MTMNSSKSTSIFDASPLVSLSRLSTASLPNLAASGSGPGGTANHSFSDNNFPTPRKTNQRPSSDARRRPPTRKAKKIRREYQLLQSQTLLLVGTASLGFLLFLLFTLPLAALVGLTVMVTSLGACLLVAFAAAKTRYRLELEHPLGLVRYLPETVRAYLTEKSLHDCLSKSGSGQSLASLARSNHSSFSRDSLSILSQNHSSSMGSLASLAQQSNYRHQRG